MSGTRTTPASTTSAAKSAIFASALGRRPAGSWAAAPTAGRISMDVSVIAHEEPLVAEGEGYADDKQHDADSRAEAETHAGDAEIIEVRDHRVGRLERTAAR